MPHLTLEYTRNLAGFNPAKTLAAVNAAMFDSGLFSEPDIKSRAIALDVFKVGVKAAPRAFIHVAIRLLSGRSDEERKQLADAVLAALSDSLEGNGRQEIQLSVETADLHRASYAKEIVDAG
jgi:5-carboxymethyl-2-hydroxymuconate isomerase